MTSSSSARDPITTSAGSSTFINCKSLTFFRKLNFDSKQGTVSIHTSVNCACISKGERGNLAMS